MTPLFTLTLTPKGKKPGGLEHLLASTGFNTIHVINVRNWRTRELQPTDFARHQVDGDSSKVRGVQIHDEEWLCHAGDKGQGHIWTINGEDLMLLNEAIDNELYKVT